MFAYNLSSKKIIATRVSIASNLLERMRGLIGRSFMDEGEALLIKPCRAIHTFYMRFPIDVLFLDKENRVIGIKKNLRPNRFSTIHLRAKSVLELPSGAIDKSDTKLKDIIEIR
jgi:uncharacterized membrane protein (UPF0127 family)